LVSFKKIPFSFFSFPNSQSIIILYLLIYYIFSTNFGSYTFIAPRQLGAIGALFGRQLLPSVCGRTGLSGAHRTVNSMSTGRDRESRDWLVSFSVGHRTVRCAI
jgi:hypothetical protein